MAEGAPGRVERDPEVVLRLVIGRDSADLQCPGDSYLEIFGSDVEMQHHLLLTGRRRPSRGLVAGLPPDGEQALEMASAASG